MKHHHHNRTIDDRNAQGADGFVFTDALVDAGIDPRLVDDAPETLTVQAA